MAVDDATLAALREMAARNPLEGRLGALYCRYCGARQERIVEKDEQGFRIRTVRMTHTDDCPWLRAQEGGEGCHGHHARPVTEAGG